MPSKRHGYKMLEYRITDVLEMNYSKSLEAIRQIKAKLLEQPLKDFNLYPLSGFILDGSLVVIQNGHSKKIKDLYFLNACKKSFQQISIDREGGYHGKISNELL